MKKALITILTVLTALLVFVSCTNSVDDYFDPPKPEPVTTKVWKVGTDEFATLQEAVNSIPKGSKDIVYTRIELIASAKGPGAEIDGDVADNIAIDFMGFDFEFTGDFGIKATNGAEVLITNTSDTESTVSLENEADDLSLIMSDGASVGIEGFTTLSVEDNQYVISAKEGADVSVGESLDDSYVKLIGMIASENNASESVTDISLHHNTIAHLANIVLSSADDKTATVTLRNERSGQNGIVEILGIEKTGSVAATKVHVHSTTDASVITNNDYSTYIDSENPGAVVVGFEIQYELNSKWAKLEGEKKVYTKDAGAFLPTGNPADADTKGYVYSLHDTDVYDRFEGWYDNAECTGTAVTEIPAGQTGHKTFYAKWTPAYKVTLKTLGGTMTGENVTSYVKGVGATLPTMESARVKGGEFQGWVTDLSSTTYVTSITAEDEGNKTFYAKFTFSVSFDKKDDDAVGTMDSQVFTVGLKQNINANTYTKASDWRFIGWATAADGAVVYTDKAELIIAEDENTITTLYAVWENHIKYVGKVVKYNAADSYTSVVEKLITPVFYSQPIEKDPNDTSKDYNVSYNFYYRDGSNSEFVKFYEVNAKDIDAGNGNNVASTAGEINKAFQESGASADSVIYYEVVDEKGQYHTNDDDYAAFYMYIPGDSGVNVTNGTQPGSYGSSFSCISLGIGRYAGTATRKGIFHSETTDSTVENKTPSEWYRSDVLANYSMGADTYQSGRTLLSFLNTFLENHEEYLSDYYYESENKELFSIWQLMEYANEEGEGKLYKDWFLPSLGELEQLRLSFGVIQNEEPSEYSSDESFVDGWNKNYFARAVFGDTVYGHNREEQATLPTGTSRDSNIGKVLTASVGVGNSANPWITWTNKDTIYSHGRNLANAKFDFATVLVRTF